MPIFHCLSDFLVFIYICRAARCFGFALRLLRDSTIVCRTHLYFFQDTRRCLRCLTGMDGIGTVLKEITDVEEDAKSSYEDVISGVC